MSCFSPWVRALALCAALGCGGDDGADANAGGSDAGGQAGSGAAELPVEAAFLGVCGALSRAGDAECRGMEDYLQCARDRCDLDACLETCSDYVACLSAAEDACGAHGCTYSDPCLACTLDTARCVLEERCIELYSCGSSQPGGACDELEACCVTQRDPTACNGWVMGQRMLGGDPSCAMLIADPQFLKAYASDPPCAFP